MAEDPSLAFLLKRIKNKQKTEDPIKTQPPRPMQAPFKLQLGVTVTLPQQILQKKKEIEIPCPPSSQIIQQKSTSVFLLVETNKGLQKQKQVVPQKQEKLVQKQEQIQKQVIVNTQVNNKLDNPNIEQKIDGTIVNVQKQQSKHEIRDEIQTVIEMQKQEPQKRKSEDIISNIQTKPVLIQNKIDIDNNQKKQKITEAKQIQPPHISNLIQSQIPEQHQQKKIQILNQIEVPVKKVQKKKQKFILKELEHIKRAISNLEGSIKNLNQIAELKKDKQLPVKIKEKLYRLKNII